MTPGAIAARERRNSEWETKRFNTTMREYIEVKYDNIYTEYRTFYESLAAKHPNKKNLLRTSTFKAWKKAVIEETFREDGVLAKVTDLIEPSDEDSASEFFNNNDQVESTPIDGSRDILSAAMNEALAGQHLLDIDEIQNVDNIIAEIISDLERDDAMQEILAGDGDGEVQYNDDEGIALDYETELQAIVEPFDYQLEVDF